MLIKADGVRAKYMWKTLLLHLIESKLSVQSNQGILEKLFSFLVVFPKNRRHLISVDSNTTRPLLHWRRANHFYLSLNGKQTPNTDHLSECCYEVRSIKLLSSLSILFFSLFLPQKEGGQHPLESFG